MADNPYTVVGSPTNYAAPLVNLFGGNQQQQQQGQQGQQKQPQSQTQQMGQNMGQGFARLLQRFLTPQQPGQPTQLQTGPAPMINSQGMGFY